MKSEKLIMDYLDLIFVFRLFIFRFSLSVASHS